MDRQAIIDRLIDLPAEIEAAEKDLFDAQLAVTKARDLLAGKENQLLLDGAIDGKNAETRAAQLKELTKAERDAIATAENQLALVKMELNLKLNQFKAYRAIAGIIASGGGLDGYK